MSFKDLGMNYTCDICEKTVYAKDTDSRPNHWTSIKAETRSGPHGIWFLHACDECCPNPKDPIVTKSTLIQKLLASLKKESK